MVTSLDKRPSLTVKGAEFGPEFRALVNKAAKRKGVTQAAFVAEALSQAARRVLSGDDTPEGIPASTPAPAGLAKLTALQAAIDRAEDRAKAAEEQAQGAGARAESIETKLDALASQVASLTAPRGLWDRIRGR